MQKPIEPKKSEAKKTLAEQEHLDFMVATSLYKEVKMRIAEYGMLSSNSIDIDRVQLMIVISPRNLRTLKNLFEQGKILNDARIFWTSRDYMDYCDFEIFKFSHSGRIKHPEN